MTVITLPHQPIAHPHLRRLDPARDLRAVADLIELCFKDTLDSDGHQFLNKIRAASRGPALIRWAAGQAEGISNSLAGYVWEESGQVVGNLSMVPGPRGHQRLYLIANVAVHPDYRRLGIARELTRTALTNAHRRRANQIWLQVREENAQAIQLYTSMGFTERTRRTTWRTNPGKVQPFLHPATPKPQHYAPRKAHHWKQHQAWLDQLHPQDIRWYYYFDIKKFRPGITGWLANIFSDRLVKHWTATENDQLRGVLSWQQTYLSYDRLWLAADSYADDVLASMLSGVQMGLPARRQLSLDHPAGHAEEALSAAGFSKHQTLIWMKLDSPFKI